MLEAAMLVRRRCVGETARIRPPMVLRRLTAGFRSGDLPSSGPCVDNARELQTRLMCIFREPQTLSHEV
mgnify:CR=1 FL=1